MKVDGGKAHPVIIKDQQFHPVRGNVEHIDLLEVNLAEKIHAQVSVELEGAEEAPGIKEGGVLEQVTREIDIEALPTDIPERITVDVSGLDIAATLTLAEVSAPAGVVVPRREPRGGHDRHRGRPDRDRGARGGRGGDRAGRRGRRAARGRGAGGRAGGAGRRGGRGAPAEGEAAPAEGESSEE